MEHTQVQKSPRCEVTIAAWRIATGESVADPSAPARRIRGAANDYNARGRGSTMSRRVYRNGAWMWVSEPASRGRFYASDRHDVKYGDVWPGEIIASYTLGGSRTPDAWYLVQDSDEPLVRLAASRRRDGRWTLTVPETDEYQGLPGEVVVPDPYWRT